MVGNGLDRSAKPSPGGRWHAKGVTDEGQTLSNKKRADIIRPHSMNFIKLQVSFRNGRTRLSQRKLPFREFRKEVPGTY